MAQPSQASALTQSLRTLSRRSPLRPITQSMTSTPSSNLENPWEVHMAPRFSPEEHVIQQRSAVRSSPRRHLAYYSTPEITVLGSSPDSVLNTTLGSSVNRSVPFRTKVATDGIRKRLLLSPGLEDADSSFPKGISPPKKKRMRKKAGTVPPLRQRLTALSPEQLVNIIDSLVQDRPQLAQETEKLIPAPDIQPLIENLEYFRRNVFKSLPNSRWGSSRDAFCFRRVRTHIDSFKGSCVSQGKQLQDAESWEASLEYVLSAWDCVEQLPDWDNPTHNKSKEMCYRGLAAQCKKAVKGSSLTKQQYEDLRERIEQAARVDDQIHPCLALVDKKLQKL